MAREDRRRAPRRTSAGAPRAGRRSARSPASTRSCASPGCRARASGRSRSAASSPSAFAFQARSESARNARPGGSISAFCEPVIRTSMPSASIGSSITPTAVMPSTTRSVSRSRVSLAISRDRVKRGRRGLARLHEDEARLGMLAQRALDRRRLDGASPLDLQLGDGEAVRGRDLAPALAELAAVHDQDAVAGRRGVDHRRFHGAGAGRGEDQDVLRGREEPLQAFLHLGEDRLELRRAVVDDRLRHREQHLGRDGRRPGGEQVFLDHRRVLSARGPRQKKAWTSSSQRPRRSAPVRFALPRGAPRKRQSCVPIRRCEARTVTKAFGGVKFCPDPEAGGRADRFSHLR